MTEKSRTEARQTLRITSAIAPFALVLSGCNPAGQSNDGSSAPEPGTTQRSELATTDPVSLLPLTRTEILAAANRAADAVSSGAPLPDGNLELTDRTFVLTLPFGCSGTSDNAWAGWTQDDSGSVVRLIARPEQWGGEPWVKSLAANVKFDAAEGFWIERPWSSSEACPPAAPASAQPPQQEPPVTGSHPAADSVSNGNSATPAVPADAAPERRTLGLAEFFAPDAPRTLQRGSRPYAFTLKRPAQDAATEPRFALRVNGRISGFPDGQPIHCNVEDPNLRPRCIVAVEFAGVGFVDLQSGKTVADWKR